MSFSGLRPLTTRLSMCKKCQSSQTMTLSRCQLDGQFQLLKWLSQLPARMSTQWKSWATINTWPTFKATSPIAISKRPNRKSLLRCRHDSGAMRWSVNDALRVRTVEILNRFVIRIALHSRIIKLQPCDDHQIEIYNDAEYYLVIKRKWKNCLK